MSVGWMPGGLPSATGERARLLRAAEAAGVGHFGVGDHVSFYVGVGVDGLLAAGAALAVTDSMPAITGIYLLPLRHPTTVARQLADLALMAPGRLVFGVGIGGEDPHELEVCGVDPKTRGRRMDESLQIVRGLLDGKPVDFHGEFFDLDQALIAPAPSQPIPILVGGRSDAAVRRAGRLGDGWLGIWVSAKRFGEVVEQMGHAAAGAQRGEIEWLNSLNVWCGFGVSPESARELLAPRVSGFYQIPFERFEKWSPYGTPEQVAEFLAPYVDAGCHWFNLIACGSSPDAELEGVAEVARLLRSGAAPSS